jgi:glycosyltransferase involved in cell wall biosynthesis
MKDKRTIYFDNQIFTIQRFGGISRYFVDLFTQFDAIDYRFKVLGLFSKNVYLNNQYKNRYLSIDFLKFKGSHIIINLANSFLFFIINSFGKEKIIHHTYFNPFYLYRKKDFHIVTVYDMIHEIYGYDKKFSKQKKECLEKADLIISISNSTTNDLVSIHKISANKIKTVYLSSSLSIENKVAVSPFQHEYILFVGLRDRYKNFENLAVAISTILIENPNTFLVCAGGPGFDKHEKELLDRLRIGHKVKKVNFSNDEELANLYHHAKFFVFPSKYEGFGIPILESMNCDCPVVLSDSSSLKEIAGNAGYYFDPESPESIFKACNEVNNSKDLRDELIEKGKTRRQDFSARLTAEKTISIYDEIRLNDKSSS